MSTYGDRYIDISGHSADTLYWPSNGRGGKTTTATASDGVKADGNQRMCRLTGILLLTQTTAASIKICAHTATDLSAPLLTIPIPLNQACPLPIPLGGGAVGEQLSGAFSVGVTQTTTTFRLYYDWSE